MSTDCFRWALATNRQLSDFSVKIGAFPLYSLGLSYNPTSCVSLSSCMMEEIKILQCQPPLSVASLLRNIETRYFLFSFPLISEEEGNPLFSRSVSFLSPRVHGFTGGLFSVLHLFLSMPVFLLTLHYIKTSHASAPLPSLLHHPPSPVYLRLSGSLWSLSSEPLFITLSIYSIA